MFGENMIIFTILLVSSIVLAVVTNILTRVGADISAAGVYNWIPEKFKMKNKKLLKLYVVYPRSLVTKSSFALYLSHLTLILIIFILFIIQSITQLFTEEIQMLICYICIGYTIGSYVVSFGFDRIVQLYYKNKK